MSQAPDLSPREAVERWLDKRRVDLSDSTISSYRYRLKLWVEWCEERGIDSVRDLTPWDVESYEGHRRAGDIAPTTLQNELSTLELLFEYLAGVGVVDDSLPESVDVPTISPEDEVRDTRLTGSTATRLISFYRESNVHFGTREHVLVELAWFTGARVGAIRALDVADYHPDEEYVAFRHRPDTDTPLKNGLNGERPVALTSATCEAIDYYLRVHREDVRDGHGRQPLITSADGRPTTGSLRDWMYVATQPCLYGPCPHDKDPQTCEWREHGRASGCPSARAPHHVRTGAITWMLDRGLPIEVVSERVNASIAVIERHYDTGTPIEEMERRRRPFLDHLKLDDTTDDDQ